MRQFPLFFIIAEMNEFGKKGDENASKKPPTLPSYQNTDIIPPRKRTKGNGGYFFTFLSRKGKEVGTMTLYDMLSLLIIATGFMLAINKK